MSEQLLELKNIKKGFGETDVLNGITQMCIRDRYKYERELENSPCISPDGNAILKMVVVYDKPRGGEGYVLGFAHFKDTNEKRWI